MSEFLINPHHEKTKSKTEWRFFDSGRFQLIGIVAAVAWIGGYLGGEFRPLPGIWELAGNLSVLAVSCVVAVGLMRLFEAMSLHREIRRHASMSTETSNQIREILAARSPNGYAQAHEIDASLLLDRLISDQSATSDKGTSERAGGV